MTRRTPRGGSPEDRDASGPGFRGVLRDAGFRGAGGADTPQRSPKTVSNRYGMRLDIVDALGAADDHERKRERAGPMSGDADLDRALDLAVDRDAGAAYFLVSAILDASGAPLAPPHLPAEGPLAGGRGAARAAVAGDRDRAKAAFVATSLIAGAVAGAIEKEAGPGKARRAARAEKNAEWWAKASPAAKAKRRDREARRWHASLPEADRDDLCPGLDDAVGPPARRLLLQEDVSADYPRRRGGAANRSKF